MRPYQYFCIFIAFFVICSGLVVYHHQYRTKMIFQIREEKNITVILGLSDLVLSTEARYVRHLSLADYFSPFQDTPSGFDLFPSGSFFGPPLHITPTPRK